MSSTTEYNDITVEITGQIGIIKVCDIPNLDFYLTDKLKQFNRPKSLNSFGGTLIPETITAIRELDEHPSTVFTVLTGEGRFFSAGADVRGG